MALVPSSVGISVMTVHTETEVCFPLQTKHSSHQSL